MKRYELTLVTRDDNNPEGNWTASKIDKILADELVELIAQFVLLIANIRINEKGSHTDNKMEILDDDIPF